MLTQNQKMQNGRYTIIRAFGQTKIGKSYEAFDLELRKNVILKEVAENHNTDFEDSNIKSNKSEFAIQAEILQKIEHKGLLKINGHFSEENCHYLVVEMLTGEKLSKLIEINKKPFSFSAFTKWADQILEAVSLLHSQSPPIIHRDIQPKNIYLKNDGNIKLSSLNIIQHSDLQKYAISKDDLFESKNLAFSPLEKIWDDLDSASQNVILNNFDEQSQSILEKPADARSDIYSLGATFYYLLTGKFPFDSLTRLIDILDGNNDPLPAPHNINSDVPKDFSDVIMKSLEIKRENRFNSVVIMRQIMRTTLRSLQEQKSEVASTIEVKKPRSIPNSSPIVQKPKESSKQIAGEQKQQLELMKKQLSEAEEKRLAAEQRASEAERLLEKQEKINTNTANNHSNIIPTELSNVDIADTMSDEESAMAAEFNKASAIPISGIGTDLNEEVNQDSADYFADLYDEPQKTISRSYLKFIAGALILLIASGITWEIWDYYNKTAVQTEQLVTSDEKVPAVKTQENTPIPTPESAEDAFVADTDSDTLEESDEANETGQTNDLLENTEPVASTSNASNPNRPRAKPIVKTSRQNRPTVRRKRLKKAKKPVKKPNPAPKPKKSVTLDDLINDG